VWVVSFIHVHISAFVFDWIQHTQRHLACSILTGPSYLNLSSVRPDARVVWELGFPFGGLVLVNCIMDIIMPWCSKANLNGVLSEFHGH
jgi:hypothetical protein